MKNKDLKSLEVKICNHYGVEYNEQQAKGVKFEISKDDEIKFIKELNKNLFQLIKWWIKNK